MIGYLKGIIEEVESESLLLDVGGVGFRVYVPSTLLDRGVRIGDDVKLYTHMQVKEDDMQLFGFFSRDDLEVFQLLISVSGIGPKGAIGLLSALSADDLRFAVLADDAETITRAPGIGKKTAQKLILELKDKFKLDDAFEKKFRHAGEAGSAMPQASSGEIEDAVQALVALGYSNTEALQAVRKVEGTEEMDSESILRAALKFIY